MVVVSALAVTVPKLVSYEGQSQPRPSSVPARRDTPRHVMQQVEAVPPGPSVELDTEATVAHPPASRVVAARAAVAPAAEVAGIDRLRADMALLQRASQAIAQGHTGGAARLLDQHGRDSRDSALHEERDGLRALVRCMDNPVRAKREGLRFVARAPQSVLAHRVLRACQIEQKP